MQHPHIRNIAVLQRKPGKEDALKLLKDIADAVSLLMRENKFKVGTLVEFYPRDRSLLGMNVNHGQKIMLRLRDPLDEFRFLPWESLIGTMLHELTHNLHGPHDQRFYSKLDELSGRQWCIQQLGLKDNFMTSGNRLGGRGFRDGPTPRTTNSRGNKIGKIRNKGVRLGSLSDNLNGSLNTSRMLKPAQMAAMAATRRAEADKKWCVETNQEEKIPDDSSLEIIVLDGDEKEDMESTGEVGSFTDKSKKQLEHKQALTIIELNDDQDDNDVRKVDEPFQAKKKSTFEGEDVLLIDLTSDE